MAAPSLLDLLQAVQDKCMIEEKNIRRDLHLSPAEYKGLNVISPEEELTCREFSRRMGLSLSRGSRVIDRLTRHGYLIRSGCIADRRCKNLRLTQPGRAYRNKIVDRRHAYEKQLRTAYSPHTWKSLKSDIRQLLEKL